MFNLGFSAKRLNCCCALSIGIPSLDKELEQLALSAVVERRLERSVNENASLLQEAVDLALQGRNRFPLIIRVVTFFGQHDRHRKRCRSSINNLAVEQIRTSCPCDYKCLGRAGIKDNVPRLFELRLRSRSSAARSRFRRLLQARWPPRVPSTPLFSLARPQAPGKPSPARLEYVSAVEQSAPLRPRLLQPRQSQRASE